MSKKKNPPKATRAFGRLYTPEERIKIAELVWSTYSTGVYTFEDACATFGVTKATIRKWEKDYPEIKVIASKYRERSKDNRRLELKYKALAALHTKLEDKEFTKTSITEKRDPNGNIMEVKTQTTTEIIPSNINAIMFTLVNTDPTNWKSMNNANAEHAITLDAEANRLESMSSEELDKEAERLDALLSKKEE